MVPRRLRRTLKRQGRYVVFFLAVVFGVLSVWQTWDVATHLKQQTRETSQIYGEIIGTLGNPGTETNTLLELVQRIGEMGIPLVLTNESGMPSFSANLPMRIGGVHSYLEDSRELHKLRRVLLRSRGIDKRKAAEETNREMARKARKKQELDKEECELRRLEHLVLLGGRN